MPEEKLNPSSCRELIFFLVRERTHVYSGAEMLRYLALLPLLLCEPPITERPDVFPSSLIDISLDADTAPGFLSGIVFPGNVSAIELNLPLPEEVAAPNFIADMEDPYGSAYFREDKIPGSLVCLTYDLSRLKDGNDSGILPGKAGEAMVNALVNRFTERRGIIIWDKFHRTETTSKNCRNRPCYLLRDKPAPAAAATFVPRAHLLHGFVYAPVDGKIRFCGAAGGRLIVYNGIQVLLDTGWRNQGIQKGDSVRLCRDKIVPLYVLLLEMDADASGGILLVEYQKEGDNSTPIHLFRTDFVEPDDSLMQRWQEHCGTPIAAPEEAPVWLLPQQR